MDSDSRRFWSRINKNGPIPQHCPELGPCWVWTGSGNPKGYGCAWFQKRLHKAHRVAFVLHHGRWPEPCCLHRCDNPACCNPAHLFEGTKAENNADMTRKGRHGKTGARGQRNAASKLTDEAVRSVRALARSGSSQVAIARRFGVNHRQIGRVLSGERWKHVVGG